MEATARVAKPARIASAALGAALMLTLLLLLLASARTQAAPLRNTGTGTDPAIRAITLTSNFPISDTHPGDGVTKTVYFSNSTSGVLTLTFEISGTPTLTLTAGAAFGDPARTYTSTATPWSPLVTYSVETGGGDYPGVTYTAINTAGVRTSIAITYVRDVTAPNVWNPSIVETSDYLYAVGTHLYYTNTMPLPQNFVVQGHADDDRSGVDRVRFSPALGDSPDEDTAGFQPWQSLPPYDVDPGATASGTITATVYDNAGNAAVQTYTYELDDTPPESTASAPPYATSSPVAITWVATDTQSGVYSTTLWYKKEVTGTWIPYQAINASSGSFDFDPPAGDGLYLFATVAADNLGNLEAGPAAPETQTVYDTEVPQSEVTWAPLYRNSSPITMTWVATASLAPLTEVRLWYRFDSGIWTATQITGTDSPGVFAFNPTDGDGTYCFATVAKDAYGKSEADPTGNGDAATMYDTDILPTSSLTVTPAGWTSTGAFTLTWDNPADLSGIAGVRYAVDVGPTGNLSGTLRVGQGIAAITLTVPSEGEHTAWLWLLDNAGNVDYTTAQTTVLRYDVTRPTNVTITAPERTPETQFAVSWSADDEPSGIASYTVEYSGTLYASWQAWLPITTTTSATFTAPYTETDYIFRVTAYDHAGNSAQAQTVTYVGLFHSYLPVVMRDYRPFVNGDFESGLGGWNTGQGPFSGHGSGMPQSVVVFDGSHRALLGEPSASNGSIHVGYGYIAQTFTLDRPYLQLQYRVVSYDIVKGTQHYYDTLEVAVNRPPNQISDSERNNRGCASTVLNPEGTLVVSGAGLVFCGGRSGIQSDVGTRWDSDWRTVTLDLSTFQGQNITLYFSIWSREYSAPHYDDHAWYNTWAYVDNLSLQE